ncbi:MAG: YbhB/YbcL family Raf kinase inhibitor-like protein [Deltaproteobacteria bacterium]
MGYRASLFFAVVLIIGCPLVALSPWSVGQACAQSNVLAVTSPAFENGGMIPRKYTCDGNNISPALRWSGIPRGTKSIAVITDDPDAPRGTFVHWVIFNIPGDVTGAPEGVPRSRSFTNGATQGRTSFRRVGYGGPCPPSGTHRYYFKVYALDTKLNLDSSADKRKLLKSMEGHVLAAGQLMGRYRRR